MLSNYPNPHPPGCYWHQAAENFGAPNLKWCEETLCHAISEPANTWSNLAYFVFAIAIFLLVRKSSSKALKWIPAAFALMGAASFYYHASNFYISQVFDFVGMYLLVHWLLAINLIRAKVFNTKAAVTFYAGFILLNSIALHMMYIAQFKFQILVAISGVLIVATEVWAQKNGSKPSNKIWLPTGVLVIVIAEAFSIMDLTRVMCDPTDHVIQGHAIWHILSALGLFLAFKHFAQFEKELP